MARYTKKRFARKGRRFAKRWNVSAQANVFGYRGALKLGSRGFTQAVKQVMVNEGGSLHLGSSNVSQTFTHNTIMTLPLFSSIQRSTTDVGVGLRGSDKIKPLSYHFKVTIDWKALLTNQNMTFMLVSIDDAYMSGSAINTFASAVGSTNLFRFTNSYDLEQSFIDTTKCRVLFKKTYSSVANITGQFRSSECDMYHKFPSGYEFKYNTGTNFGDKNLYLIAFGRTVGGTAGTTQICDVNGCVDLVYQDPA